MRTIPMDTYLGEPKNDDICSVTSFEEVGQDGQLTRTQTVKDLIAKGPGKQTLGNDEMPDVLYTVEYCNDSGVVFETRESAHPLDPTSLNKNNNIDADAGGGGPGKQDSSSSSSSSSSLPPPPPRKKPIIEIKSRWAVVSSPSSSTLRTSGPPPPPPMRGYDDLRYEDDLVYDYPPSTRPSTDKLVQVEKTEMVIHSPHLLAALGAVVGYYPCMPDFSSEQSSGGVTIEAPYCVLVHHMRELEGYKRRQPGGHSGENVEGTARAVDVLLGFLRGEVVGARGMEVLGEMGGGGGPGGGRGVTTTTFDMFWMLLKPGSVVYKEGRGGEMAAYVVSCVSFQPGGGDMAMAGMSGGGPGSRVAGAYLVDCWSVGYFKGYLQRQMETTWIYPWVGEREISGLQIVPAQFVGGGGEEARAMAEKQVRLGRLYWELARGPAYKEYEGEVGPRGEAGGGSGRGGNMTGRVVVDCEGWERFHDGPGGYGTGGGVYPGGGGYGRMMGMGMGMGMPPPAAARHHRRDPSSPLRDYLPQVLPRCTCPECKRSGVQPGPGPFAGFDKRDPRTDSPPANEELYFLVIRDTIPAFILGERRWASLRVDSLRDVKPDKDAFRYLVLDPEVKMTVKSLIGKFASSDGKVSPWPNDFVKNKGEGRIFLLHGSPGVGKTCTAECVAELTHRPLLSLTSGDISTSMSASSVERNLHYFLELGERFGALVLLDEADVYLEERRTRDLRRNGLVSIFLRALEYYRGVLFLTTNRVEAFDSAFTSRIHVALHYRRLTDDDRRRVWMNNFERLERDSAGRCYVPQSAREYAFESADMRALRWNGREIRNGLQTAVALAETEAVEMGVETVIVGDKHIRAVVRMSSGFREFLRDSRRRRGLKGRGGRRSRGWDGEDSDEEGEGGSGDEEEEEEDEEEEEEEDDDEEGSVSSAETEDNNNSKWNGSGNGVMGFHGHPIQVQGGGYHHPMPPPVPLPPLPQGYHPHQQHQHQPPLPYQQGY